MARFQPDQFKGAPLLERVSNLIEQLKMRGKLLGRGMLLIAVLYSLLIIIYGWQQLILLDWRPYMTAAFYALFLYLASLLLQLFIWLRLLGSYHKTGWFDVHTYMQTLLLRRLPGGIWHWAGRTAVYKNHTQLQSRIPLLANVVEWLLMVAAAFVAFACWGILYPWYWRLIAAAIGLAGIGILVWQWLPTAVSLRYKLGETALWAAIYTASWSLGGIILYLLTAASGFLPAATPFATFPIIWAVAGGIAALTVIMPSGLGVRELGLTLLLGQLIPTSAALLIAILIRIIFTIADLLWGGLAAITLAPHSSGNPQE